MARCLLYLITFTSGNLKTDLTFSENESSDSRDAVQFCETLCPHIDEINFDSDLISDVISFFLSEAHADLDGLRRLAFVHQNDKNCS
jgi:hypothetical protein